MDFLAQFIESLGLANPWTYLALFLAASFFTVWRLEALLEHGLEGTALGTLVMPYCSGLGNLIFVFLVASKNLPSQEVATNCLVNNVTNLTLLLGLPAILWGLDLAGEKKPRKLAAKKAAEAKTVQRINRLSLQLALAAVLFFSGVTWALAADGRLDEHDGVALIGVFFFWQCFQIFDVLKTNVRQRQSFGPAFYLDLLLVLLASYALYTSLDWLVSWLGEQKTGLLSAQHLGWLTGWLMVVPNAALAFYYAAKRRADIVYASQVGDGHICIPLCLGLSALIRPLPVSSHLQTGLLLLIGAALAHFLCLATLGRLPRWLGWPFLAAYAYFVGAGLVG